MAGLDSQLKARLLASLEAGRLALICGAGLSMAPPSSLPSARAVANACYDKYAISVDPECDLALRDDLEALAEHFAGSSTLKSVFIDSLVPWPEFVRHPNPGHAAVADFLITRAAAGALSANIDVLVERCAWNYGAEFSGSLDGDEALHLAHSPLLKFHGCAQRDRSATVWTKSQLEDPIISNRIAKNRTWMASNLREKDFLVVGFWSDWSYFNEILGNALQDVTPLSITLVDPSPLETLRTKAPNLWELSHKENVAFKHVQQSGADTLDELRRAFSQAFLRKILFAGKVALEARTNQRCDPVWLEAPDLASEEMYALRRDAEGVPASKPAQLRQLNCAEQLGLFHLLLRCAGASLSADGYALGERSVRVINGSGSLLSSVKDRFKDEPPVFNKADIVVCVGALNFPLPQNVVRAGRPGDIVRPLSNAEWLDFETALTKLQL